MTIDEFQKDFEKTIDSVTNMDEHDKFMWKEFGHKIYETIRTLHYTNKNDVKAVQKNLEAIKNACALVHKNDNKFLLVEEFDCKADNYIDKKIKFIGWLIIILFSIITAFGTYIFKTTMANIDKTQIEVKETKKEIREFKDVFIEYLKINK